jgi:hypothetical protein
VGYVVIVADVGEGGLFYGVLTSCANGGSLLGVEVDLNEPLDVVLCGRGEHVDVHEAVPVGAAEGEALC